MTRRILTLALAGLLATVSLVPALARGRQPDDEDKDNFPDYNRIEMHPKPRDPQPPPPEEKPVPPAPKPPLNTPANLPIMDDTVPQPAPNAVPLPDGASEPPLPGDIQDTLVPSATNQK